MCVRSCSTAPARKVSHAAMRTLKPFSMSQNEICSQQQKSLVSSCGLISATPSQGASRTVPYLGQVGGLPDTVDTTESDHVGPAMTLRIHDIAEDIHTALGLQDLY